MSEQTLGQYETIWWTFYAGETPSKVWEFQDSNEDPRDLTGAVAYMDIGRTPNGAVTYRLQSGSGISSDLVNGSITTSLSSAQTADLQGQYYFSLQVIMSDGTVEIYGGKILALPNPSNG